MRRCEQVHDARRSPLISVMAGLVPAIGRRTPHRCPGSGLWVDVHQCKREAAAYSFFMFAIHRARPSRRQWLLGLIVLVMGAVASVEPGCAQEGQTVRLAVGGTGVITLRDNPSTGYRWQVNHAASQNLSLVSIVDAGFVRDSKLLGAPGTRRFSITAHAPGTAVAVFDYSQPWVHGAPARRHVVTIEIGR